MEDIGTKLVTVGVMISAAVAAAGGAVLLSGERTRRQGELSVPGYAEQIVKADRATWSFYLQVEAPDPTAAGQKLKDDVEKVRRWLVSKGVPGEDMRVHTTGFDHAYRGSPESRDTWVTAQIEVNTSAVDAVRKATAEIDTIAPEGLRIQSLQASMSYTKIDVLRSELEKKAIGDARARAEDLANSMGRDVGKPKAVHISELSITDATVPAGAIGPYPLGPSENQKVIARASTTWVLD